MKLHVDATLGHLHVFALKKLALQGSIGLANQESSASAKNAMPRDAFAARRCRHGVARRTRTAFEPQDLSNGAIC